MIPALSLSPISRLRLVITLPEALFFPTEAAALKQAQPWEGNPGCGGGLREALYGAELPSLSITVYVFL